MNTNDPGINTFETTTHGGLKKGERVSLKIKVE